MIRWVVTWLLIISSTLSYAEFYAEFPERVEAGNSMSFKVYSAKKLNNDPIVISIKDSYGSHVWIARAKSKIATIEIPSKYLSHSGIVDFTLKVGDETRRYSTLVAPRKAIEPVAMVLDRQVVKATNDDWTLAITFPEDYLGNPVSDGTHINFKVQYPEGVIRDIDVQSKNLLGYGQIFGSGKTGRAVVVVNVEGRSGPAEEFLLTASEPAAFSIQLSEHSVLENGVQNFLIETSELRDKSGNFLPNGTAAQFNFYAEGQFFGSTRGVVVNGKVKAKYAVRRGDFAFKCRALVSGRMSENELALKTFPQIIPYQKIAIDISVDEKVGMYLFRIGPIKDEGNALVQNGSLDIAVKSDGQDVLTKKTVISRGMAEYILGPKELASGIYNLHVNYKNYKGIERFEIP